MLESNEGKYEITLYEAAMLLIKEFRDPEAFLALIKLPFERICYERRRLDLRHVMKLWAELKEKQRKNKALERKCSMTAKGIA
jgi:hypothetical protein